MSELDFTAITIGNGAKTVHGATILLPASINRLMLAMMNHIPNSGLEYGVYLKGTFDPVTLVMVIDADEYYIPRQSVTGATISFTEDVPDPDWNVVIHRHPAGCTNFSNVDVNELNGQFDASLLFIPPFSFPQAVVNWRVNPQLTLQLFARVEVTGDLFELPEGVAEEIAEKVTVTKPPKLAPLTVT